ncbi:hypothetical protein HG452_003270 [Candidatus Saccharibacteria bacterium]|jgi:hypothetical protein|nr:hypothetical protein [Candidatus Saccharibacteria bacterium]
MTATKVFTGKHGIFSIQVDVEDGDFTLANEQYESIIDEAITWQIVCGFQNRAKALGDAQVSKELPKERTRPGFKKALKNFESCSIGGELEFYENKLTSIIKYRRDLISEAKKTSDYLASLDYDQYDEIHRGLNHFERVDRLINLIDRKVIPSLRSILRSIIRVLKNAERKDAGKASKIKKSKHDDKKHGRRVKKVPDRAYKSDRGIARANKKANQYAFV